MYILDLTAKEITDQDPLGGKSDHTKILVENKIEVPCSLAIKPKALQDFLGGRLKEFEDSLHACDFSQPHEVEKRCQSMQQFIKSAPLPVEFAKELKNKFQKFKKNKKYFAIRSSALGEDSKESSFAGQMQTYLFVTAKDLEAKVRACWCSAFEASPILYGYTKNKQKKSLMMGVLIQEMVSSKKSGVLFTVDPRQANRASLVIVAGYGLGEGIVADKVATDLYYLDRKHLSILESKINEKETQIVFDEQKGSGTKEAKVATVDIKKACLKKRELQKLAKIALKIESIYNHPQDIEWCFNEKNELLITQTRAITTLVTGSNVHQSKDTSNHESMLMDNSNIVESFPGVLTPGKLSTMLLLSMSIDS